MSLVQSAGSFKSFFPLLACSIDSENLKVLSSMHDRVSLMFLDVLQITSILFLKSTFHPCEKLLFDGRTADIEIAGGLLALNLTFDSMIIVFFAEYLLNEGQPKYTEKINTRMVMKINLQVRISIVL